MSPGPGSDLGPGSAFLSNNPGTRPRAVSRSPVSSPGAISSSARPLNTLAILVFHFMTTLEYPIKDIFSLVFLVCHHLEGFIYSAWDTDHQLLLYPHNLTHKSRNSPGYSPGVSPLLRPSLARPALPGAVTRLSAPALTGLAPG